VLISSVIWYSVIHQHKFISVASKTSDQCVVFLYWQKNLVF